VIEARERLRARFIGSVDRLGRLLEAVGAGADTISLYERATDADPIAESLYRRLMQLHLSLGQPAEALRSYRRCRDMLSIMLGLAPSAETERLAREIGQS
jgi:LuxR family transcriptional regulator, maltose regulon positive regulatory protein